MALPVPDMPGSKLTRWQADKIVNVLDNNGDGVITSREFKSWYVNSRCFGNAYTRKHRLFPDKLNAISLESVFRLRQLLEGRFGGNIINLFSALDMSAQHCVLIIHLHFLSVLQSWQQLHFSE